MKTITIDVIKGTADVHAVEGDVGVKVIITNTPSEWDNCTVFALLTQGSESQHIKVVDNTFEIPPAFTDANKAFKFGVYAVGANASRDVRPSIWIRVADSDFTTEDIEITSQTLEDILMLQSQYTQYEKAEEARAKAEEVRQENESARKEAEEDRKTELEGIKTSLSNAEADIDDLEDGKVDKIDGKGLSTNDYTDHDAVKLAGIEYGAQENLPVDQTYKSESSYAQSGKAVAEAISNLVNGSPGALDTLYELAKALGDDPNFATTVMNEISKKVDKVNGYDLAQIGAIGDFITISMHSKDISNAVSYLLYDAAKIDSMLEGKADMGDVENLKGQLQSGVLPVEVARYADYAYFDFDGRAITETYAEKSKIMHDISGNENSLEPNTQYILGVVTELSIFLPSYVNAGDVIYLTFISGEDATTLAIETTNAYDFELIPEPKMAYEIYGKYDGRKWMLGYAEFNVSDDDLI